MRIPRSFLTLVATASLTVFSANLFAQEKTDDYPRRDAVECHPRGGIPNFLAKVKASNEEPIRIGYLGGSITAASGWRVKSLAWLQERFPDSSLEEINAAIGGTGSDLGVFRLQQDVLTHAPDLLFVEFAVNDGGASPEQIHKAMEGIVRQTWKANPEIDIIFVYTLSQPFLEDLQNGKFSRSASAMEEIADHYSIPSIHFGLEVAAKAKDGSLIFKGEKPENDAAPDPGAPMLFSTDGVHPLVETGHVLYRDAIARSWPAIEGAASDPLPHTLIDPLRADNWEEAKLVSITEAMQSGGWKKLDSDEGGDAIASRFSKRVPEMWLAAEPGAALSFHFRGEHCGFYDLVGPDGGRLEYSIDGGETKTVNRIDGYCTYTRLSKFVVGTSLDAEREHTVQVKLLEEAPDKATILFEKNRADLEKNPAKYEKNVWHVGSIMLIGDLVP